jgi:hypothetical protein
VEGRGRCPPRINGAAGNVSQPADHEELDVSNDQRGSRAVIRKDAGPSGPGHGKGDQA